MCKSDDSSKGNIAVEVSGLAKRFRLKQKAAGLMGSVRSLWNPVTKEVDAVHDISFRLEAGEILAFIGPNGAGKSTTIKMLTGILHPSAGEASVLGWTPWRERQIREAIRLFNAEDNTTIFLTSQDAGDIETLCKRVIIINHGQIIFDDRTSMLKRQYLTRKVIDVRFGESLEQPFAFAGVDAVKQSEYGLWNGLLLVGLWGAAALMWCVVIGVFYCGLRRYESGSALNVNV